ncbi:E3 ubiquitin-protein ligase XB3 [Hordeum vulgare]|nr:E3 ubiquitin-protein ligase XB3 [Hordeum vulgare]
MAFSGFVDSGVVLCGVEEVMAVRIALRCSREDSARLTEGSVCRESIAFVQRAIGSSGAGSSMCRRVDPSTGPADYESHRELAARRGKERIRISEAYLAKEMTEAEAADAAARAATEEEAICARILKKLQPRNTRPCPPCLRLRLGPDNLAAAGLLRLAALRRRPPASACPRPRVPSVAAPAHRPPAAPHACHKARHP